MGIEAPYGLRGIPGREMRTMTSTPPPLLNSPSINKTLLKLAIGYQPQPRAPGPIGEPHANLSSVQRLLSLCDQFSPATGLSTSYVSMGHCCRLYPGVLGSISETSHLMQRIFHLLLFTNFLNKYFNNICTSPLTLGPFFLY